MLQEYLGYCLVLPAFVGLAGMLVSGRLPHKWQPIAVTSTVLIACLLSGFLLLGKNLYQPERHWHWLPVIAVWSWLAGIVGFRRGSHWLERTAWALACGGIAGYLLVPTWKDLADQRVWLMLGLATAVAVLILATDWLGRAARPLLVLFSFGVASLVGAAWIGAGFSLTNARWLLIATAIPGGIILAAMLPGASARLEAGRLLPLLSSWLLGGLFIGAIEPNPPHYEMLILGSLPIALLAVAAGLRTAFQRPESDIPEARM